MRIVPEFQESIVPVIPQITTLLPGVHQAVHKAGTHALTTFPEQGKISDFVISISQGIVWGTSRNRLAHHHKLTASHVAFI